MEIAKFWGDYYMVAFNVCRMLLPNGKIGAESKLSVRVYYKKYLIKLNENSTI